MLKVTNPILYISNHEVNFDNGNDRTTCLRRVHGGRVQWSLCDDGLYVAEALVKAYDLEYVLP